MKRLNIAMLGEQAQVVEQEQAEPVQSELEVLGSQVEDDLLQAQQTRSQIDAMDGAVADAQQAQEDLEQESEAAQQATQLPKEQQQAALESIQRNVKRILKTIGMEKHAVDMESFRQNTQSDITITMEGIKDILNTIWEAIKQAWSKAMDFVKDIFNSLFDASTKLSKRANKIKTELNANKDKWSTPLTREKMNSFAVPASVVDSFVLNFKTIEPGDAPSSLKEFNEKINKIIEDVTGSSALTGYNSNITAYCKKFIKMSENMKNESDFNEFNLKTELDFIFTPIHKHTSIKYENGYRTEFFLSDRCLTIQNEINVYVDKSEKKGVSRYYQYNPLELNDAIETCDAVVAQMMHYKKIQYTLNEFNKTIDILKNNNYDLANNKEDFNQFQKKFYGLILSTTTKNMMNLIKTVATKLRILNLNVNKAAIDWCAASMRLYS